MINLYKTKIMLYGEINKMKKIQSSHMIKKGIIRIEKVEKIMKLKIKTIIMNHK